MSMFSGKRNAIRRLFLLTLFDGKSVALVDYEGIFSTEWQVTHITSLAMDEGKSHRQVSFCKPIIYKLSLRFGENCRLISAGNPKDLS